MDYQVKNYAKLNKKFGTHGVHLCIQIRLKLFNEEKKNVGSKTPRLYQRIAEHKNSAIGKHFIDAHSGKKLCHFRVLRKCQKKFWKLTMKIKNNRKWSLGKDVIDPSKIKIIR